MTNYVVNSWIDDYGRTGHRVSCWMGACALVVAMSAYCAFGQHHIGDQDYFYTVNPEGGYGTREILCCEKCIKRPENAEVRRRMLSISGCKELEWLQP
jgi:hypothetical protein